MSESTNDREFSSGDFPILRLEDEFYGWLKVWPDGWTKRTDGLVHIIAAENEYGEPITLRWVLDRLAYSEEVMPEEFCDYIELPSGSTIADAVRKINSCLSIFEDSEQQNQVI